MTPAIETLFRQSVAAFQTAVHDNAVKKGFWTANQKHEGLKIALTHSELSEALEAMRCGDNADDKIPKFKGGAAELADAMIRIFDLAEDRGYDLAGAMLAKHEFNKGRPKKHGKLY